MDDVLPLFDALNGDDLQQARGADRMLRARLSRAADARAELALWHAAAVARGGALSWRGTQCLCAALRTHAAVAAPHAAPLGALAATALLRCAAAPTTTAAQHCARLGALQLARAVLRALAAHPAPGGPAAAATVLAAATAALAAAPPPSAGTPEAAETAYEAARLCAAAARLPLPATSGSSRDGNEEAAHVRTLREAVALHGRVTGRVRNVLVRAGRPDERGTDGCALLGDVCALERRAARAVLVAGWLLVRAAGVAGAGAAGARVWAVLARVPHDAQFALLQDSDSACVAVLEACAHAALCAALPPRVRRGAWAACTGTLDRLLDLVGSDLVAELVGHAETRALAFVVRLLHALLSPSCPVPAPAAARYRAMLAALRTAAEHGAFPFSVRPLLALIARYERSFESQ